MYRFYKNRCFRNFVIAFSFISLLSFNLNSKNANAVAFVDDVVIGGGVTVSTGALAALAGSTLVAGGVYLDSTLNDGYISKYLVNKMIASGQAMEYWGVKTLESGKQILTWTADGIRTFWNTLTDINDTGYTNADSDGYTHFSLNRSVGSKPVTLFTPTSSQIEVVTSTGYTYRVNCSDYTDKVIAYCFTEGKFLIGYYKIGSGWWGSQFIGRDIDSIKVKCKDSSICVDTPQKYKDVDFQQANDVIGSTSVGNNGSISYQPSIGIPLNNNDGVMSPGIDFPYGKSWDELFPDISIPVDKPITGNPDISVPVEGSTTGTIETTGTGSFVLNIPILGDILRALLDILALLKTFIANLLTGLLDLIKTVCIPSDTYFENNFNSLKNDTIAKLGYQQYIDIFGDGSSKELKDITINYFGKTIVICKLTTFNYFRNLFNDLVYGFTFFGLAIYNYNQIYRIFRNNNYAKMEQTIERMKK